MNFISTYRNLLKTFSLLDFLMKENHEQSGLRKDTVLVLFLKQLKTYFEKVQMINFMSIYSNLLKYSEAVVQPASSSPTADHPQFPSAISISSFYPQILCDVISSFKSTKKVKIYTCLA